MSQRASRMPGLDQPVGESDRERRKWGLFTRGGLGGRAHDVGKISIITLRGGRRTAPDAEVYHSLLKHWGGEEKGPILQSTTVRCQIFEVVGVYDEEPEHLWGVF